MWSLARDWVLLIIVYVLESDEVADEFQRKREWAWGWDTLHHSLSLWVRLTGTGMKESWMWLWGSPIRAPIVHTFMFTTVAWMGERLWAPPIPVPAIPGITKPGIVGSAIPTLTHSRFDRVVIGTGLKSDWESVRPIHKSHANIDQGWTLMRLWMKDPGIFVHSSPFPLHPILSPLQSSPGDSKSETNWIHGWWMLHDWSLL